MVSIDIVLDLIPDDANRRSGGSSVRRRCELIALALVIGTVGVILQFGLQGFALGRNDISTGQFNWSAFLSTLTAAGVVDRGLLLAVALGLVVMAPGERYGRLGVNVLNAISVLVASSPRWLWWEWRRRCASEQVSGAPTTPPAAFSRSALRWPSGSHRSWWRSGGSAGVAVGPRSREEWRGRRRDRPSRRPRPREPRCRGSGRCRPPGRRAVGRTLTARPSSSSAQRLRRAWMALFAL